MAAERSARPDAAPGPVPGGAAASLAGAAVGSHVRIVTARLDEDLAAWVAAVGLHEGEEVVVLRRAALGGPLHVRTASGGEFAVAREIALRLEVVPLVALEGASPVGASSASGASEEVAG